MAQCGRPPEPERHTLEDLSTCPRDFMRVLPMGEEFWLGTFRGDRVGYGRR